MAAAIIMRDAVEELSQRERQGFSESETEAVASWASRRLKRMLSGGLLVSSAIVLYVLVRGRSSSHCGATRPLISSRSLPPRRWRARPPNP